MRPQMDKERLNDYCTYVSNPLPLAYSHLRFVYIFGYMHINFIYFSVHHLPVHAWIECVGCKRPVVLFTYGRSNKRWFHFLWIWINPFCSPKRNCMNGDAVIADSQLYRTRVVVVVVLSCVTWNDMRTNVTWFITAKQILGGWIEKEIAI